MPQLKLRRTKNRDYFEEEFKRKVLRPAEYAIYQGEEPQLRIILNGRKWRACQPNENSKIGLAISPIGVDKFREVKKWAFDYLEKNL